VIKLKTIVNIAGELKMKKLINRIEKETGRVGYLVLYLMGAPIGLLLLLWVLLGNNIFGAG